MLLRHFTQSYPKIIFHPEEKFYKDPVTGQNEPFPRITDEPTVDLSVVIPAYDEELRREYRVFFKTFFMTQKETLL